MVAMSDATASFGRSGALAPPMSVRTQPGWSATAVMPSFARACARLRVAMLTAALLIR